MVYLPSQDNPTKEKKNIGVTQSILAGIGSGIFKIFEGGATLGATLLDLGVVFLDSKTKEVFVVTVLEDGTVGKKVLYN